MLRTRDLRVEDEGRCFALGCGALLGRAIHAANFSVCLTQYVVVTPQQGHLI